MNDQTIEFQAKIYVFDLNNCAREFGFKSEEHWVIQAVNKEEKSVLEMRYFPTISAKVLPDMLAEMLASVKFKLSQQLAGAEKKLDAAFILQQQLRFLIAYNPARPTR
ncbi:hypothetical protein [Mucilaginibacter aquariorum]|uniref:His-Xaa-Ser system protein HxsD n=1 Tax=Mucilaginibacter aquariorum TaxID=2967225 RepID=A0ABT1T411_9SPHI|nr:hypothetical protein [Mucilaginibacter aquariorum]MCQ6959292.1 hypothetical protein [Mucilaginibacter aquariorum]